MDPALYSQLETRLSEGLSEMGLGEVDAQQQTRLLDFLVLITKWNRVYNLTAVRDPREMLRRHIFDSLAVQPYLPRGTVLDIGTGAGLPGIPLAIINPETRFTLLDAAAKRIRFVNQAIGELSLDNVKAVQARVEDYTSEPFAHVISRAFTAVDAFFAVARPLLSPGGSCLAMTATPQSEWLQPGRWRGLGLGDARDIALSIPGEHAARHLLIVPAPGSTR